MRDIPSGFGGLDGSALEPRFVVQVSWDSEDTDYTYLTSSAEAAVPIEVDTIENVVENISGQTQKINPDTAVSTIGTVSLSLIDLKYLNPFLQSNNPNTTPWTNTNCTATENNSTAPDGTTTAALLNDSVPLPVGQNFQSITIEDHSEIICFARYYKQGTANQTGVKVVYSGGSSINHASSIDWTASPPTASGDATLEDVGDGWYLHKIYLSNNGSGNTTAFYYTYPAGEVVGTTGTVSVWGMHGGNGRDSPIYTATTTEIDGSSVLTTKINTKLSAGDGLRGKICRIYVGYEGLDFDSYDLRLTYIVDNITYKDGMYSLRLSDIQRNERKKIFTPQTTNLAARIAENELVIPVTTADTTKFQTVIRGSETFNFPRQSVTFIKIDKEVICINTRPQFDTTNGWHVVAIQRGALGTRAVEHRVEDVLDSRKPAITEHIYLEGSAPKIIYALLTGVLMHGDNVLADPYDFTTWSTAGTLDVTATADETPTGWGSAYSVTDNDAGSFESIFVDESTGYTHGDTWTISVFIKKEAVANSSRFDLWFQFGAANSYILGTVDASTGSLSITTLNSTEVDSGIESFNDDWWRIHLSAFSTTTGTTTAQFIIWPAVAGVADTGSVTLFCATLCSGYRMGWTVLPRHWHLGIHPNFVRLSDYQALGDDMWQATGDTGRWTRIENPGTQDGKKFIESEILVWLGAFMPVYASGEVGIKRLTRILSDSSYQVHIDESDIVSYTELNHKYEKVINDIRVDWNYVDNREDFTKESVFIDAESIAKHGKADIKNYEFKTVHTGVHTDENLLTHFDTIRDRYSGPPLEMGIRTMPSMGLLEVGDTVRVTLDQVRDFNSGGSLDRTFEIQQITSNWTTGALDFKLFGSAHAAVELTRTSLSSVLQDEFYTSEGTNLTSVLTIVAGAVTADGTLTGHADLTNASAIFYYDGNLTINAGVTVNIVDNVQLRIKGTLTIAGTIDGIAAGPTGGAATTQFDDATTTTTWDFSGTPPANVDINLGNDGYFGVVRSGTAMMLLTSRLIPTHVVKTFSSVAPSTRDLFIALPSKGSVSNVPYFGIRNLTGYSLEGLPADLRGHGGVSSIPVMTINQYDGGTRDGRATIRANGAAGGDGGAGLCTISRGMAFAGAGVINLSGGSSGVPGSYTYPTYGNVFWSGHGAPGAPGALLVLIDGDYTNPDITTTRFIANYGSTGATAGATELSRAWILDNISSVPLWPYASSVVNLGSAIATQDVEVSASAHRMQYLPEPEQPVITFGGPLTERGEFNDLLRWHKTFPPTAGDAYGHAVAIVSDGSRFAASDLDTTRQILITRNVKNPINEQFINTVGNDAIYGLSFDKLGERLLAWAPTYNARQGRVHIYSRSTVTWSLEQTITFGSGVAGTGGVEDFGDMFSWDDTGTHLILCRKSVAVATNRVEYWSRSGTTWSYQESITAPATTSSSYPSGCELSRDGNWLVIADYGTNGGTVHLYERTTNSPSFELRDSITVPGYDLTSPITNYQMGWRSTALNASPYNGVHIGSDGVSIIATGALNLVANTHVIVREGDSLKYVGNSVFLNGLGLDLVELHDITDNGLVLITRGCESGDDYGMFRRQNTLEQFGFRHGFTSNDSVSAGSADVQKLAGTGQFFIVGNSGASVGAAGAGLIDIWEYYPEAD